jgi:hypothetical protein
MCTSENFLASPTLAMKEDGKGGEGRGGGKGREGNVPQNFKRGDAYASPPFPVPEIICCMS